MAAIEVFGDVTCPFTHVGLKLITREVRGEVDIVVRAWPLEWVNGEPLEGSAVATKVAVLREQLGGVDFDGFDPEAWPTTSIPALNLAGVAAQQSVAAGLRVSLDVRAALFERGEDVSDPDVLMRLAVEHGVETSVDELGSGPTAAVQADYDEGKRRGVRGSPDFWVGGDEFFCPSLEIGHDAAGALTAHFDTDGIDRFLTRVGVRR